MTGSLFASTIAPTRPDWVVRGDLYAGGEWSKDGRYRFRLWRRRVLSAPFALWIMLNPSTADEFELDPTLRRDDTFTTSFGLGSWEVVNLFAWKETDSKLLPKVAEPIGAGNDQVILERARAAKLVICGWGAGGKLHERESHVAAMLLGAGVTMHCLRTISSGAPEHPLYLPATLRPVPWTPRVVAPAVESVCSKCGHAVKSHAFGAMCCIGNCKCLLDEAEATT